jgi:PAS domain S-box-containing protein
VYFKDAKNRFVLVNKVKAASWNTRADAMVGKTDFDYLPAEQAQKSFDDDSKVLQTGQAMVNSLESVTGADGSVQWVSVTKVPRYDSAGKILGTMGICRNVTEQKKLEDMSKALH